MSYQIRLPILMTCLFLTLAGCNSSESATTRQNPSLILNTGDDVQVKQLDNDISKLKVQRPDLITFGRDNPEIKLSLSESKMTVNSDASTIPIDQMFRLLPGDTGYQSPLNVFEFNFVSPDVRSE